MNDDAVTRWAQAKQRLSESAKRELEALGLTWDSFRQLESDALSQMGDEVVQTEYGWVQKIPDSPIQYKLRRVEKPDEEMLWKPKLKLLRGETK